MRTLMFAHLPVPLLQLLYLTLFRFGQPLLINLFTFGIFLSASLWRCFAFIPRRSSVIVRRFLGKSL